jgi:hypothetical protein
MEIPQSVIDEVILKLHQSKQSHVLLGGTSGKSAHDVALHTSKLRHHHQKQAIEDAIGVVLEFASDNVKARLGKAYDQSADLKRQTD